MGALAAQLIRECRVSDGPGRRRRRLLGRSHVDVLGARLISKREPGDNRTTPNTVTSCSGGEIITGCLWNV